MTTAAPSAGNPLSSSSGASVSLSSRGARASDWNHKKQKAASMRAHFRHGMRGASRSKVIPAGPGSTRAPARADHATAFGLVGCP